MNNSKNKMPDEAFNQPKGDVIIPENEHADLPVEGQIALVVANAINPKHANLEKDLDFAIRKLTEERARMRQARVDYFKLTLPLDGDYTLHAKAKDAWYNSANKVVETLTINARDISYSLNYLIENYAKR